MKPIFLYLFLLMSLSSDLMAHSKKKRLQKKSTTNAQTKPTVPPIADKTKNLLLCANPNNIPFWYLAPQSTINFPAHFQKPKFYRLLSYNETEMRRFLKQTPYADTTVDIILPVFIKGGIECKTFKLSRTKTMDDKLQAKYPDIMSFKGFEAGNPLNTVRIETNEKTASYMISYNGDVLFINPITDKGKTYYATYSKNDPNFIKKEFEK